MIKKDFTITDGNITKNGIIEIESGIKLLSIADNIITTTKKSEVTIDATQITSNSLNNRYKFLFKDISVSLLIPYAVYYDTIDKDIVLIPNPDNFIVSELKNSITVKGYKVGILTNKKQEVINTFLTNPDTIIPIDNADISNTTITKYVCNLHGINSGPQLFVNMTGITTKITNLINIIRLKRTDVFGDVPLPIYNLNNDILNMYSITYNHMGKPDYIYIPLPF